MGFVRWSSLTLPIDYITCKYTGNSCMNSSTLGNKASGIGSLLVASSSSTSCSSSSSECGKYGRFVQLRAISHAL